MLGRKSRSRRLNIEPLEAEVASGAVVPAEASATAAPPAKPNTGVVAVNVEAGNPAGEVDAPAGAWLATGLSPDGLFAETKLEDVVD